MEHGVAQFIHAFGHVDLIPLALHATECVHQRFKDRKVGSAANVSGIGGEIEQHDRDFSVATLTAFEGNQLADPGRQHDRPLGAGVHILRGIGGAESTGVMAASTGYACRAGATAKHNWTSRSVELRDRDHDRTFYG